MVRFSRVILNIYQLDSVKRINIDDYLNKIIKHSGLSKEEVLQLAQKKREELSSTYVN